MTQSINPLAPADPIPDTDGNAQTCDTFRIGDLKLLQPLHGHRFGLDAVLLAMAASGASAVIDLGCGVGTVGLAYAALHKLAQVRLVDRDAEILDFARRNIASNRLDDRVRVLSCDIFSAEKQRTEAGLARESADLVLTNPPFSSGDKDRPSPKKFRRAAHEMQGGTLDDWLRAAVACLEPGGRLALIHRADAVEEILAATKGRLGGVNLRFVHPAPDKPAVRVLLSGVKGSRAGIAVQPPLILRQADGALGEEAEAINAGRAPSMLA